MKKYFTLLFFIIFSFTAFAQNWIQINNNPLTSSGRTDNSGFSISGTGYILGGSDDYNYYNTEAWAYDTAAKSWSAIAPYPDVSAADGKVAVAVDSLGYAGLGVSGGFTWQNTWYSYSKSLNQWNTTLTPFPGAARAYGTAFTVGGEIYITGGVNGANENGYSDFWKYDPPSDTWTPLGHCPALGVNFYPVSFAINGMGYVGTGGAADSITGITTPQQDFWQYNPTNNTWKQMAPFPGGPRMQAIAWATCDKGYVGAGYETHTPQTIDSDFYEFDPANGPLGTWTQIANYGGGNINGSATFVIGQTGYVCGGQRDSANYNQARGYTWTNDDWSYTKIYTPTFSASPASTICSGQSISFVDTSNYSPLHWYWQFPGGTPDTSSADSVTVKYASPGNYNVIVSAWNDCDSGAITDTNYITVSSGGQLTVLPPSPQVCSGQSVTLSVNDTGSFTWNPSTSLSTSTGDSVVANPIATTTYVVSDTSSGGCALIGTDTVFIIPAPALTFQPPSPTTCAGQPITLSVDTSGRDYVWSPVLTLSSSTGDSVVATPLEQTTYTVEGTDSLGCAVSGLDTVYVNQGPNRPKITLNGNLLTSTASEGNQWYEDGAQITGATNKTFTVTTDTGCYWVIATNPANGYSINSDTICLQPGSINLLSINNNLLSIYPNPTGGEIFINISSSVADVKNWSLQITDVLGRTLYTWQSLNYSNDIDLSNLPGGVYFITVINKTARAVVPVVKDTP